MVNTILVVIKIQKLKYLIQHVQKGLFSQDHLYLVVEHIIHKINYLMKENMSYQKINQQEKESSFWVTDNLLLNLQHEDHKVIFNINLAPGPGSYRLPSDFGHYD